MSMTVITFAIMVFAISAPFGAWRVCAKKHGRFRDVMLAIHVPVVVIIVLRIAIALPLRWESVVMNIVAFSVAQYIGGVLWHKVLRKC